jgi:tryptophan synthase alpha chain
LRASITSNWNDTVNRLETRLARLREAGRKALVPYIMTGDPVLEVTVPSMHALVDAGADLIELGMPFSDPEADGPAIQAAAERALANGVRIEDVFEQVRRFRREDDTTPVILMGYLNVLEQQGAKRFIETARAAGVDGLILVNLPPEEATEILELARPQLNVIFLTAPTTTRERVERIARAAAGFIYYVSLKGITGADHIEAGSVHDGVARLRAATDLPVLVGFGIKDANTARTMAEAADGVVVGSMLVSAMGALAATPDAIPGRLRELLADLRRALDAP